MRRGAQYLVGEHDFTTFSSVHAQSNTRVRTVYELSVSDRDPQDVITIRIRGDGFLYNMVRIIAGSLMEVGSGRIKPVKIREMLEACDRSKAGPTAPAKGLTLEEIRIIG